MQQQHAIVLGATGATGRALVQQLLDHPAYGAVSIFVRKTPDLEHKKLKVHEIDFSKLKEYKNLIFGDVLFSAMGTTRKNAGSKSNQYEVDYTYQYEFAKMASDNGVDKYSLVSSYGANKKSLFFYFKIKGALEEKINIVIQINGKKKTLINTRTDQDQEIIFKKCLEIESVKKLLADKHVVKKIYVKNKLVNIVVK